MTANFVDLAKRGLQNPSAVFPFLKKKIYEKSWPVWQSLGYHIVPNHFYYPIPDTEELSRKEPWGNEFSTDGIELNEQGAFQFLEEAQNFFTEYSFQGNGFPTGADGPILYAMVRTHNPDKIIEVGSGSSTEIALQASKRNVREGGEATEIVAIEPYPDDRLKELGEKNKNITIIERKAEEVLIDEYQKITNGDFLFIDSSHTVTIGNDVAYLYLRVLPQLPKGVFVHIHDIHFPFDFPKEWVMDYHRFWTEQYLLQTFLMFNDSFSVIWPGHYISQEYSQKLEDAIPTYQSSIDDSRGGSGTRSFWMRRTK